MLLFERHGNLPRGRRQLVHGGRVVYDSQGDAMKMGKGVGSNGTLGDVGVGSQTHGRRGDGWTDRST